MAFKMRGNPFKQTKEWIEGSEKASEHLQRRSDVASDIASIDFSSIKEKTGAPTTDIKSLVESNPNMTSSQLIKILLKQGFTPTKVAEPDLSRSISDGTYKF